MTVHQLDTRLYNWASLLEDNTRDQAIRASRMPFIFPHMALMPDAHLGLGATVGSVIPTLGAIMPAAVGVDIGCGMIAVRSQFTSEQLIGKDRSIVRERIENLIPLSAGVYNDTVRLDAAHAVHYLEDQAFKADFEPSSIAGNWRHQLGSLGSGNHFIELCLDEEDQLWLFLHSGSRGVGNKIAQRHIKVAQQLMDKWWIQLPDKDLAYLVEGTDEFWTYIKQMRWAQEFARLNREVMMDRVKAAVGDWLGEHVETQEYVNCHHNYTERERHYGKDVWLSRKGAIDASEGVLGLIPGSMGASSYVVRGLGNRLSLDSSPHGAGRLLSRTAARKKFTMDDLTAEMGDREWRKTDAFLDEHPQAYKPIDQIMEDAADLVKIEHELRQIVNIKGD